MPPRKRIIRSALLAIIALVAVTLMAVPGNATFAKKYDLVISPPSATAGGTATFSATYTNKSLYKIGSTDLSVPAGFTITGASSTKGYPVTFTPTKVSVRNLSIGLGYSFTVTVTATIGCDTASSALWTAKTMTGTSTLSGSTFFINNPGAAQTTTVEGCPVTINVTKYEDTNLSGNRETGEPGLEFWDFEVREGETLVAEGSTNADGNVPFSVPRGHTYTVCETIMSGWTNTDPVDGSGCRTVTSAETLSGEPIHKVFGNAEGVGQLGCPVGTPGFSNTDSLPGGEGPQTVLLTRFNNADGTACVAVPFVLERGTLDDGRQFVDFYKDFGTQVQAQFTLTITWDPEADNYPVTRTTQVDVDGPGDGAAVDLEWCDPRTGATPVDQLYELPTAVPWCLVSQSSTMDSPDIGEDPNLIQVTEVIYGLGDPRLTR